MALTFPLPLAEFFADLPVLSCDFHLPDTRTVSRTRGGEILPVVRGNRLWVGRITLRDQPHRAASAILARLERLLDGDGSLLVTPWPICGPAYDPTGAILGDATPVIHTIAGNNRELRLQGLPPGYVLAQGDFIGRTYGSDPTRYQVHRLVTGATANGSGVTPLFEVSPHILPGAAVGQGVVLIRPAIKAVLLPGSLSPGSMSGRYRSGITFDFVQKLV